MLSTFHSRRYVANPDGSPLAYKLNGFRVLLILLFITYVLHNNNYFDVRILFFYFWDVVVSSFFIGMAVSLFFYIRGPPMIAITDLNFEHPRIALFKVVYPFIF